MKTRWAYQVTLTTIALLVTSYHQPVSQQRAWRQPSSILWPLAAKPGAPFQYQIFKWVDPETSQYRLFIGFHPENFRKPVQGILQRIQGMRLIGQKTWVNSHPQWSMPGWELIFEKDNTNAKPQVYGIIKNNTAQLPFFADLSTALVSENINALNVETQTEKAETPSNPILY